LVKIMLDALMTASCQTKVDVDRDGFMGRFLQKSIDLNFRTCSVSACSIGWRLDPARDGRGHGGDHGPAVVDHEGVVRPARVVSRHLGGSDVGSALAAPGADVDEHGFHARRLH
jgi:hypothetical protein